MQEYGQPPEDLAGDSVSSLLQFLVIFLQANFKISISSAEREKLIRSAEI